jgi:hypothetical protein
MKVAASNHCVVNPSVCDVTLGQKTFYYHDSISHDKV